MEGKAASRGVGRMPGRSRQGREGKEPAAREPCGTDHTPLRCQAEAGSSRVGSPRDQPALSNASHEFH